LNNAIEDWTLQWEWLGPITKTLNEFIESNKKYLILSINQTHDVYGVFLDEEPEKDIFIKSFENGDKKLAILKRDFNKTQKDNPRETLILVDCDEFDLDVNYFLAR